MLNLVIAYDQPRDVYGQVAISLHQLGDREDKECSWCISEEIKWERGDFDYTLEDVLMGSLD